MQNAKQLGVVVLLALVFLTTLNAAHARPGNITMPIEVRSQSTNNLIAQNTQVGVNVSFFDALTGGNFVLGHGTLLVRVDANGRVFPRFDVSALNGNSTYFMEISVDNVTATPRVLLSPAIYAESAERFGNQTTGVLLPTNFSGAVNITTRLDGPAALENTFVVRNITGQNIFRINAASAFLSALASTIFNITLHNTAEFTVSRIGGSPLFRVLSTDGGMITITGTLNVTNITHPIGGLIVNNSGGVNASALFGKVGDGALPNPSASTLGGIQSYAAVASQWINTISTSGVPSSTQPAFTDISGTVAATQLPDPAAGAHGGVRSLTCGGTNKLTGIGTNGTPSCGSDQSGGVDLQTFTTIGANTWTKPSSGTVVRVQMWAGGGSGGRGGLADAGGGGGGGGYFEFTRPITDFAATETCNVGAGGVSCAADECHGTAGDPTNVTVNSVYNGYQVFGGGGGYGATAADGGGGGGGGVWGPGQNGAAAAGGAGGVGCGASGAAVATTAYGDICGSNGQITLGAASAHWGGGGGSGGQDSAVIASGGNSTWGGGGGGGGDGANTPEGNGGDSIFGGDGGKGSTNTVVATAGSQPGGGGGGSEQGASGAGGDGKCVITVW